MGLEMKTLVTSAAIVLDCLVFVLVLGCGGSGTDSFSGEDQAANNATVLLGQFDPGGRKIAVLREEHGDDEITGWSGDRLLRELKAAE